MFPTVAGSLGGVATFEPADEGLLIGVNNLVSHQFVPQDEPLAALLAPKLLVLLRPVHGQHVILQALHGLLADVADLDLGVTFPQVLLQVDYKLRAQLALLLLSNLVDRFLVIFQEAILLEVSSTDEADSRHVVRVVFVLRILHVALQVLLGVEGEVAELASELAVVLVHVSPQRGGTLKLDVARTFLLHPLAQLHGQGLSWLRLHLMLARPTSLSLDLKTSSSS